MAGVVRVELSGILEGLNLKVKLTVRKSFGFKSLKSVM
jgi:transposase